MISVLIVEDEPPILNSLCRNIEKSHEQFEIAGTAFDGQEAIDFLQSRDTPVDVLITDIHMPVVNGLELLEYVQSRYPRMITLVLSGFQDFHYAKEAFKSGIHDYMLKPIDKKALKKQLSDVARLIRERRSEEIQGLLSDIFYQNCSLETLPEILQEQYMTMLLFCSGPFPVSSYDFLLPGNEFWQTHKLDELASSYFPRKELWLIPGKSSAEQILIVFSEAPLPESSIQNLHWTLSQYSEVPVTLCVSPALKEREELLNLHRVHHNQRKTIHRSLQTGRSSIIQYCDQFEASESRAFMESFMEEHTRDLSFLSQENLVKAIAGRTELFSGEQRTQAEWEMYLKFIFYTTLNTVSREKSFDRIDMILKDLISNSYNTGEILDGCEEILRDILLHKGERREKNEALVKEMAEFLTLNFNKPLSSQTLSNKFGLVPSYISTLFKNEMGISPADYILKIRMNHAREQLLENRDLMTREVAQLVGYSDPLYFSRVFKKFFGMSPSQIRKSL
ncbi:MAG: response regulator [Spirochaetales bacterium]|nr:response regulator [Spirochaetales bacterium]